jgi:hypothetical protein
MNFRVKLKFLDIVVVFESLGKFLINSLNKLCNQLQHYVQGGPKLSDKKFLPVTF